MEYTNSRMRELIAEYIHSSRDRDLLLRRLVDGATFDQLSTEFDLTSRQIRRIVYKLQEQLFKHL